MSITPTDHAVRTLKDGYWDHTALVRQPDGSLRVRKSNKHPTTTSGPWGTESLRREIRYLLDLSPGDAICFPSVLHHWDTLGDADAAVGYEMPYYPTHRDAGVLAREEQLDQAEIDRFQDQLADLLFGHVHVPAPTAESLSRHFDQAVTRAFEGLSADPMLPRLLDAERLTLNGTVMRGPRAAWQFIQHETDMLAELDQEPGVRLHGDFFLENILWRPLSLHDQSATPALIMIDPVSVAGISRGPALFDLVKYVSYASGELLALRSEWVELDGFDATTADPVFSYRIKWQAPGLRPFQNRDWHSRFTSAYLDHHGVWDRRRYALIDGYFSAAMALNTRGHQRQARLLKATLEFNRVLGLAV
ncbi:phosphotransferase [Synoicihabitans lomoniglobus]|uniref:Phosphotransferase n=1 Tax=Synoicihabitans lomoniglobus TaxID=2909285 RepID=A0AAF0CRY0_9BACT|nr:phosphotransferase [Opitutaceae bacterium LMO-M01]WED66940.1 phosphotransferase [Opitutaceae bacterium LMO-M01]